MDVVRGKMCIFAFQRRVLFRVATTFSVALATGCVNKNWWQVRGQERAQLLSGVCVPLWEHLILFFTWTPNRTTFSLKFLLLLKRLWILWAIWYNLKKALKQFVIESKANRNPSASLFKALAQRKRSRHDCQRDSNCWESYTALLKDQ